MSRSFTSRPAVTNSRGRGRGTQTRATQAINAGRVGAMNTGQGPARPMVQGTGLRSRPTAMGQGAEGGLDMEEPEVPERQESQDIEQRMSYQGGYTLITPNQRKREQISQVAQRETQAYEAHKQQNTPKQLNYVGTTGGGQTTQAAARRELIQASQTKTGKLLQNQQRKTYFKQKEEEEIQQKKSEQRRKAEENERRKKEREQADAHKWDNQRKRVTGAFLDRIENENRKHQRGQASGAQALGLSPSVRPSPSARNEVSSRRASDLQPVSMATQNCSMATQNCSEDPEERVSEFENQKVTALSAIYPQYSNIELLEILKSVDFSLDAAINLLSD